MTDEIFVDFTNSYFMRAAIFKPKNYSVSGNFLGFFLSNIFLLFDFYNYFSSHAVIVGIDGYLLFGLLVPSLNIKNTSSYYTPEFFGIVEIFDGGGFG